MVIIIENCSIKKIVKTFPLEPGVYIMKDVDNNIIYIGKAKNLKKRVSRYFNKNHDSMKVAKLVLKINTIDYIVTDTELEALILECNLIKKYKPIYNILLKDDKGFKFIKISPPPYSKISVVNKKFNDGSIYIGPYMSSFLAKQIVATVNKIFKLPTCKKEFLENRNYVRPCLNYYIDICSAPCCNKIGKKDYQCNVDKAVKYLKSGMKSTLKELRAQMENESKNLNFEEAAKIRDQIRSIEKINCSEKVMVSEKDIDVLAAVKYNGFICATLLIFRDYKLIDKKQYLVTDDEEIENIRKAILLQNYTNNTNKILPPIVYIDDYPQDFNLIKEYIFKNVDVIIPKEKKVNKIIEMAKNNSKERIIQETKLIDKNMVNLNKLKEVLNLPKLPKIIEAYDVSNFGFQTIVGGMILFVDGKPKKSGYRKFKMKFVDCQDDYKSMAEMVERRFKRYKLQNGSLNDSFFTLPDLILIDGGYAHISVIDNVIKTYDLNIPVYGMVKDGNHTTDFIVDLNNNKINIKNDEILFLFIKQIQDEIHRFTVSYSRKSHSLNSMKLSLCDIPKVGKVRQKLLIEHFKSVEAIKQASLLELQSVDGLPKDVAKQIFNYFHPPVEGK